METYFLKKIKQHDIKPLVSDVIYRRGMNYFRLKRVELIIDEALEVHLHVGRDKEYCVNIYMLDDDIGYDCSCPYAVTGDICKHIVAACLSLRTIPVQEKKEEKWKKNLDKAMEQLQYAGNVKRRPHPFFLFFSLQHTYRHQYELKLYKVKASVFSNEIYNDGLLQIPVAELPQHVVAMKLGRSNTVLANKITTKGCLNASESLISFANVAQQSGYYYYDSPFFQYLHALADMGAQVFYGKLDTPFVRPLQVITKGAESRLVLTKLDDGFNLNVEATIGDRDILLKGKANKIIGDDPQWLLTNYELIELSNDFNPDLVGMILAEQPFNIPQSQESFFIDNYLMPLANQINIVGDNLKWHEVEDENPTKQLFLSEKENKLIVELGFEYAGNLVFYPSTNNDSLQRQDNSDDPDNIHLIRIKRNPALEEDIWRSVSSASHGLKRGTAPQADVFVLRARVDPVDFLLSKVPTLVRDGFEIFGEDALKKTRVNRHAPSVSLNISSGIDWFDISPLVQFGDVPLQFSELRKALRKKQRYVKLSDGSIGEIPDDFVDQYKHLFQLGEQNEESVRFSDHHLTLIDQLLLKADFSETDSQFNERLSKLKNFKQIEEKPLHRTFEGTLRPYQKSGVDWLHFLKDFKFGGILADDMGLGKTVQMLAFLQSLRADNPDLPADLIVLPRSLLINWEREVQKFTPNLSTTLFFGNTRAKDTKHFDQYDLVLTTYGTMRSDIKKLRDYSFHYVVLDESQAIKNPNTQTFKAVRLLKSKYRVAMTGTPVENSTFELWSQFSFLNPGLLGNIEYFKREFGNPIQRNEDEDSAKLLRQMVYPFILRRTKSQVAPDLPPRTERVIYMDMEPAQRKFYERTRDEYRAELLKVIAKKGMNQARFKVLEGLLRLRQICNHPRLYRPNFRGNSGKPTLLPETMENLASEGHKALIFSQFVKMLKLIEGELEKRNIPYAYLDGQTRKRQEAVDAFQENPDLTFFLISLKAGGVGLNLTAADYVIHVDPWWNPAVEMQATDRTHRIGQDKPVFVYKLITRDSVEEKILQLQEKKKELVEKLITTEGSFFKNLSSDDIQVLFS